MKLKLYAFLLVFASALFFISCEKENFVDEKEDENLLKQILIEGEVYYEYVYNNAGLILEEKSKYHYSSHKYNTKNQLLLTEHYWDERIVSSSLHVLEEAKKRTEWVSPKNSELDSYLKYEYDRKGKLKKITTHRSNRGNTSYSTYKYNQQGRVKQRTSYHKNVASVLDKFYYDSRGNLVKKERFYVSENGTEKLQTTTQYEFDNKQNPYFSFRKLMTPGKFTNTNNIVKETYTLHFEVDNFIEKVQVTEYQYEYNERGFPVRRNGSFEYVY